ncbi:MAG: purine nucleotide phosphorylase [Ilumatobacteraceae bacterium]|nr:purine nucleotide phosphorylase [Ilumatobacteraceae bacterium]
MAKSRQTGRVTHPDPVSQPFDAAVASAARLAEATGVARHDVAIVLGSGWKPAADRMGEVVAELPMTDLGGFPEASVQGHGTTVRSIVSGDKRILAFMGRVHLYEGHHPNVVAHAVRTAVRAGCSTVVLTNAAGGLRAGMRPGQPVLIADHLNLTGRTPLLGPNDDRIGPRFPDMGEVYTPRLRELAHAVDPTLEEAVYCGLLGPTYETPAEVQMVATLGGELVGMSTVLESIAAAHAGADLLAVSLVTNLAAGLADEVLDHEDVLAVAAESADRMGGLIAEIVGQI